MEDNNSNNNSTTHSRIVTESVVNNGIPAIAIFDDNHPNFTQGPNNQTTTTTTTTTTNNNNITTNNFIEEEFDEVNFEQPYTPLSIAAMDGDLREIWHLVVTGHDLDETNQFGYTAIQLALASGQLAATKALIDFGANMFINDIDGNTFWNVASIGNIDKFEICEYYIDNNNFLTHNFS